MLPSAAQVVSPVFFIVIVAVNAALGSSEFGTFEVTNSASLAAKAEAIVARKEVSTSAVFITRIGTLGFGDAALYESGLRAVNLIEKNLKETVDERRRRCAAK